jgi:hypothetical protein
MAWYGIVVTFVYEAIHHHLQDCPCIHKRSGLVVSVSSLALGAVTS